MRSVTVLIPNFNRAAFLPECLRSIEAQTFEDWTAVVGDDCSTDDSIEVVQSIGDSRIRVVRRQQNVGWATNSNLLLAEATGDYVAFLHSDDWWEPTFLSRLVELLDRTPGALIGTTAARLWLGSANRVVGPHRVWPPKAGLECPSREALRIMMRRNRIVTPSLVLARRELYLRHPGFEASMPNVCDWLMWLRAAADGSFVICPEALGNYRQHASSMSGEARRLNRYGRQFVQMTRLLQHEWARGRAPYPGAANELAAMVTIRLIADAFLRHEQGDRAGAIELAVMAREIAPSARWHLLTGAVKSSIAYTGPSAVHRAHTLFTHLARSVFRGATVRPTGRSRRLHYVWGLVDDLRDDLHQGDPKLQPAVAMEQLDGADWPSSRRGLAR